MDVCIQGPLHRSVIPDTPQVRLVLHRSPITRLWRNRKPVRSDENRWVALKRELGVAAPGLPTAERVEPGLWSAARATASGASRRLPRVPAKVPRLNRQMVYRGGCGSALDAECAALLRRLLDRGRLDLEHRGRSDEMVHFVGLDVSVKETSVCVVDDAGKVILEQKVPTEPADIIAVLTSLGVSFGRIGIEYPTEPLRHELAADPVRGRYRGAHGANINPRRFDIEWQADRQPSNRRRAPGSHRHPKRHRIRDRRNRQRVYKSNRPDRARSRRHLRPIQSRASFRYGCYPPRSPMAVTPGRVG